MVLLPLQQNGVLYLYLNWLVVVETWTLLYWQAHHSDYDQSAYLKITYEVHCYPLFTFFCGLNFSEMLEKYQYVHVYRL